MQGGEGGGRGWHGAQWFVYEGEWHLCHPCHLCRPCHHDMEGGGVIGKCAATRVVTWVSSKQHTSDHNKMLVQENFGAEKIDSKKKKPEFKTNKIPGASTKLNERRELVHELS